MVRRLAKVGLPKDFQADSLGTYSFEAFKNLPGIEGHVQTRKDVGKEEITGWFLGTKAENMHIFCELITEAMNNIAYGRRSFHPEDPGYVTEEIKKTPGHLAAIQSLKDNFYRLITFLNDYSVPWFSMRYQGHMNWDVTLPSLVGYFTAMLQNQNNVSIQGSPATTFLEIFAANDICTMIGFDPTSWGHITCDGTVANIEALWSARELRYLPIGIKDALNNEYKDAKDHVTVMFGGEEVKLVDLDEWQLLNLSNNEILEIPLTIAAYLIENANNDEEKIKEKESEIWDCLTKRYSVNALGMVGFYEKYHLKEQGIKQPAVIVPSSKHYSWPKAASLLGLGHGREEEDSREEKDILEDGLINVFVDEKARMDTGELRDKLNKCRENRKPVILTVAVIGSTEESAVDPLKDIITMRNDFREPEDKTPFDFNIHADAAWGGYLVSIIRKDFDIQKPGMWEKGSTEDDIFIQDTSKVPLSTYVIDQMKELRNCDSVTVDPHKWGYVPYPAGSLCYRNGKTINLVTFGAPYIGSESGRMMSIGESGVEGSKPGASAAAVFLSHCVIRPSVKGYGKLMGQSL